MIDQNFLRRALFFLAVVLLSGSCHTGDDADLLEGGHTNDQIELVVKSDLDIEQLQRKRVAELSETLSRLGKIAHSKQLASQEAEK